MTAALAAVRGWFDQHGWKLDAPALRAALEERGAEDDLIVELLDEGADRRRAQPQPKPAPATTPTPAPPPASSNGSDPQNLDAERSLLGAMLLSPAAIAAAQDTGLTHDQFYRGQRHGLIYQACLDLRARHIAVESVTVSDELEKRGQLDQVGGRIRVHELAAIALVPGNASHYAQIVREQARRRDLAQLGQRLTHAARAGTITDDLRAEAAQILDQPLQISVRERFIPGGRFALQHDPATTTLWGTGRDETAWAAGEGLMIAGPQGVGKTTLMQQLTLARIGLRAETLGLPVTPDDRPVLYIAADRPAQAKRSLARMVGPLDQDTLDQRLIVHPGPPLPLITTDPNTLTRLAKQTGAGTIIVDSLKDVAAKLADDEYGGRINLAFQTLISEGIELVIGHHQRKASTDNKKPNKLDDVYGSTWITAGLGSVFLIWGEPGDILVELRHLKQPRDELGPYNLHHDHTHGKTSIVKKPDLLQIALTAGGEGITAQTAAELTLSKPDPTRNEREKVRGRLDRLADQGSLLKLPGRPGGSGGSGDGARYIYNGPGADRE